MDCLDYLDAKVAKWTSNDVPQWDKYFDWVTVTKAYLNEGSYNWAPSASSCTAIREGVVKVDQKLLAIPGKNGERRQLEDGNYPIDKWDAFVEDIKQRGVQEQIFIGVEADAQAYIYEGNHRIQAALQAGLTEVPVEVRYFGNSQRFTTTFPESIYNGVNPEFKPTNDVWGPQVIKMDESGNPVYDQGLNVQVDGEGD